MVLHPRRPDMHAAGQRVAHELIGGMTAAILVSEIDETGAIPPPFV
jgi:hypothetical protein